MMMWWAFIWLKYRIMGYMATLYLSFPPQPKDMGWVNLVILNWSKVWMVGEGEWTAGLAGPLYWSSAQPCNIRSTLTYCQWHLVFANVVMQSPAAGCLALYVLSSFIQSLWSLSFTVLFSLRLKSCLTLSAAAIGSSVVWWALAFSIVALWNIWWQ